MRFQSSLSFYDIIVLSGTFFGTFFLRGSNDKITGSCIEPNACNKRAHENVINEWFCPHSVMDIDTYYI